MPFLGSPNFTHLPINASAAGCAGRLPQIGAGKPPRVISGQASYAGGGAVLTETGRAEEAVVAEVAWSPRAMWTLFEPVHAVTYFAPEARAAFEAAGLRGFWRGYFAGRAAPLGPVGPEVVTASFYNFAPAMVERAIPAVWALAPPATALQARQDGANVALRRLLAGLEKETVLAAERLGQVTAGLDCGGRVLAAANTALPQPDSTLAEDDGALARLWQAATILREHRGDGHFAALTAAGTDGCEVLVLRCALNMRREDLQPIRGWTDEQWDAARARLTERGLIRPDGEITAAGREAYAAVEEATDRAAARPWQQIGADATAEVAEALLPLAQACAREVPYANPIGVPPPGPAAG